MAESAGFVDIGQGPATALISPRRFSDAGAIGGTIADLMLPPPLNQQESEQVDRLYQETMERFYTIDEGEPNNVSTPNDDAASTSIKVNQETELVDPNLGPRDPLTQGVSTGYFSLQPMETVRLRRIETMAKEPLATRIARIEAHIESCKFRESSCER